MEIFTPGAHSPAAYTPNISVTESSVPTEPVDDLVDELEPMPSLVLSLAVPSEL
ncbi:MAG: hypothetical protein V2I33_22460 [Kangiellaceae bacterium]|jgi:hypothetical protein|nr:hypothetical protein [Kangiellaceae bacterium]